ncbi:MAG: allophanate hydrolase [Granulosicoccus sp.]
MDLSINSLHTNYKAGTLTTLQVLEHILQRLSDEDQSGVWISTVDADKARDRATYLDSIKHQMDSFPLYGLPFSVKDNIDVAGEPTTAACPDFSYTPDRSATVVQAALDAGAIFIGKTNLDQFATGLVGVRSPYGIPRNPFNASYIPGGSSAGAGVSVSTGMVNFALGTDTGGSGRVPASYNGIAGLKPAPGLLSRHGLVFACRSIDTPSIFTRSSADAISVFNALSIEDAQDPFFQNKQAASVLSPSTCRFGVPGDDQLEFFGNQEVACLFLKAVAHLSDTFAPPEAVNFDVLTDINDLMFFGPLLAERDVSVGEFVDANPGGCHSIVQQLITGSRRFTAADAYKAIYRVAEARSTMESIWSKVDVLMVPTVGSLYSLDDIAADPLQANFNNGYYTNFANPLGLSAISTPFAVNKDGVPWGVTFLFKPGLEASVAEISDVFSSHWAISPKDMKNTHTSVQPVNARSTTN